MSPDPNPYLGDIETLFAFYQDKNRLTIKKVENDLLKIDWKSKIPIAQQLIDLYADINAADSRLAINSRYKKTFPSSPSIADDAEIGKFLRKWVTLENKLFSLLKQKGYGVKWASNIYWAVKKSQILPAHIFPEYEILKNARNRLVHELEVPMPLELEEYFKLIDDILDFLDRL